MGTQQALTTEQLELLTIIYSIEDFSKGKGVTTSIKEILTQDHYMTVEEFNNHYGALVYYGYLDKDGVLTIDGKQYISLFMEYLEVKERNPSIVINNSFALINIKKLNVGLNAVLEVEGIGEIIKGIAGLVNKVKQLL